MGEEKERTHPSGVIGTIFGIQKELDVWKSVDKQFHTPEIAARVVQLTEELNQQLIEYLLERRDGTIRVGRVELWKYHLPPLVERMHAFSMNRITFLLPKPLRDESGASFLVRARLSDLRKPDVLADSLKARKLVRPQFTIQESRDDFVPRTVNELLSVENARTEMRKSEPGNPLLLHLRNLSEYLVAGRLLALTQMVPVPRLYVAVQRDGPRIEAKITFNRMPVLTRNYPAILPNRPAGNTEAFIKAGVLSRAEVV